MSFLDELFPKTTVRILDGHSALMSESDFWTLIDRTHSFCEGNYKDQMEFLSDNLGQMSQRQLVQFDGRFQSLMDQCYTTKIWAAAYIISNKNCPAAKFEHFRGWLIAQGKLTFYLAMEHADTLSDISHFVATVNWKGMTELSTNRLAKFENRTVETSYFRKNILKGEEWDPTGDELKTSYPKLWERYEKAYTYL